MRHHATALWHDSAAPEAHPEQPLRRVLVPTDFSPTEAKTLDHAVALARLLDAKLILLHVVDINDPAWSKYAGSSDDFMRQLWTKARAEMDRLTKSLASEPLDVEAIIVEGIPVEEIVRHIQDSDLLVVGRPQPKPFWRFFSKETARRTMERAECGVLVVRE